MSCKLNLRRFPHDIQKCTLELESCKLTFMTVLDLISLSLSYLNSPFHCVERVTATPRFHKGPREKQNLFAITKLRYIEVLFHIFYIVRYNEDFVI